jgi:3-oxoacyl-[acyl-carrier protein] reductase
MHPSIDGRVVIITGGGRGLGRAMALGLAAAGAKVAITGSREGGELAETLADCVRIGGTDRGLALRADVGNLADCERVVAATAAKWGRVNVLVNNAGRGMTAINDTHVHTPTKFWDMDAAAVRGLIETNVIGVYNMAHAATPHLLAAGWGRIVNLSTSMATMQRTGWWPYGVSKWAVEGATVIMARDLAETSVTVNALLPGGATNTRMIPGDLGDIDRLGPGAIMAPEIMVPPMLYLASTLSDGKSGDRYVAKLWDRALPPEQAAAKARFPCHRTRTY